MNHDIFLRDLGEFDFDNSPIETGDLKQSAYFDRRITDDIAPGISDISFGEVVGLGFDDFTLIGDTRAEEEAILAVQKEFNVNKLPDIDLYLNEGVKIDPFYKPYDEDLTGYEDHYEKFQDAKSYEGVFYIKKKIDGIRKTQQDIENGSTPAYLLGGIGGIVLDPTAWIPFLGQASATTRLARAGQLAIKNIPVGAGVGIVRETFLQQKDEFRTIEDSAYGVLAETIIFGSLGGIAGALTKRSGDKLSNDIVNLLEDADKTLDVDVVEVKLGDNIYQSNTLKVNNDPRSVGAAERTEINPINEMENLTIVNEGLVKPLVISTGGRTKTSLSLTARKISHSLTRGSYQLKGDINGIARTQAAEEVMAAQEFKLDIVLNKKVEMYKQYKANGGTEIQNYSEFLSAVSTSIRSGGKHPISEVAEAARVQSELMDEIFQAAVNMGLIPKDAKAQFAEGYLNRVYNITKITEQQEVFHGELVELLHKSFKKRNDVIGSDGIPLHIKRGVDALNVKLKKAGDGVEVDASTFNYDEFIRTTADEIIDNIKGVRLSDAHNGGSAIPSSLKGRTLAFDDKFLEKWLVSDSDDLLKKYQRTMVSRTVERQYFGVGKKAIEFQRELAKKTNKNITKNKVAIKNINITRLNNINKILNDKTLTIGFKAKAKLRKFEAEYKRIINSDKSIDAQVSASKTRSTLIKELFDNDFTIPDSVIADYKKIELEYNNKIKGNMIQQEIDLNKLKELELEISESLSRSGEDNLLDLFGDMKDEYKVLVDSKKITQKKADSLLRRDIEDLSHIYRKTFKKLTEKDRGVLPGGKISRSLRVLKELSRMSALGGVVVSSLPDLARLITVNGFVPFVQIMVKFATSKEFRSMALTEKKLMSGALERMIGTRSNAFAGLDNIERGDTFFERTVNRSGEIFSELTLLPLWNQITKGLVGVMAEDRLINFANDIITGKMKTKDITKFAGWGIDKNTAVKIAAQYKKYGSGTPDSRLANFADWDDIDLAVRMQGFLSTVADDVIITPGAGDLPKFFSKEIVSTVAQFKSFAAASNDKILLAAISNHDKDTILSLVMMAGMGTAVVALKDIIADREVERSIDDWLIDGLDRSGMFSVIGEANFLANSFSQGRLSFGALRGEELRRNQPVAAGLAGAAFGKALDVISVGTKLTTGTELRPSDVNKLTNAIPLQNHFAFQSLMNNFVKEPLREDLK